MRQRTGGWGERLQGAALALAVAVAGCESAQTPAVQSDASSDAGPAIDRVDAATQTPDADATITDADATVIDADAGFTDASGAWSDIGPSVNTVRATLTRAAMSGDASTPLDVDLALLWVTETVAATTVDGGVSADDPAGFFVQGPGGAIFMAIDPATLSPRPEPGDYVYFTATLGEVHAGARWLRGVTNYGRIHSEEAYPTKHVLDLSRAVSIVSGLDEYEHHLIRVNGTIAGDFADAGVGFESAQITTEGIPTATPDLVLRVATAVRSGMNLRRGCAFTSVSPLWRHDAQAQVHAWTAEQITLGGCPGDSDSGVDAGAPLDGEATDAGASE